MTSETNASYDLGSMTNPKTGSMSTRNQIKRGLENQHPLIKVQESHETEPNMWDNQNIYDDGTSLFTQRNHFEVMASNKARLKLELDLDFKNEMDNALLNLERHPTVKNKVWQQLIDFN